jgi:hypothetical protein
MKKQFYLFITLLLLSFCYGKAADNDTIIHVDRDKAIYIPHDLRNMDLHKDDSTWSFKRMRLTPNFAIFWQKGFGDDLLNAPDLDGHPMKVDLNNLAEKLESYYRTYRDSMKFVKPGSKSSKYRMMVMLNYSLEGTAYGGDYDGQIGALWIAPNRIQDKKLNCIAHELGHCFQSQIGCDGEGESWGGTGFFEMTSQWMLWNVNPNWVKDEQYHWDAFKKLTHKAFLDMDNIYHSPYIIEYWSEKHGLPFIAEMYRQGKRGEDPVITYKKMTSMSQQQFCDEMFDACRRIVNFDYKHAYKETRIFTNQFDNPMSDSNQEGWQIIPADRCPEDYGFNIIPVKQYKPGKKTTLLFNGLTSIPGYNVVRAKEAGWRYGFVAITQKGRAIYSEMGNEANGKLVFKTPTDTKNLWLVVMGAPTEHHLLDGNNAQWPYKIKFK